MPNSILLVDHHYRRHTRLMRAVLEAGFELAVIEEDRAALHWLDTYIPEAIVLDATHSLDARVNFLANMRTKPGTDSILVLIEAGGLPPNAFDLYPDNRILAFASFTAEALSKTISQYRRPR